MVTACSSCTIPHSITDYGRGAQVLCFIFSPSGGRLPRSPLRDRWYQNSPEAEPLTQSCWWHSGEPRRASGAGALTPGRADAQPLRPSLPHLDPFKDTNERCRHNGQDSPCGDGLLGIPEVPRPVRACHDACGDRQAKRTCDQENLAHSTPTG